MQFNPECIRDILLECEDKIKNNEELYIEANELPESLKKYSADEVFYHLKQCKSNGLFNDESYEDVLGNYVVNDITEKAHDLIKNTKEEKIWKKILNKGVSSLPALISVVADVLGIVKK